MKILYVLILISFLLFPSSLYSKESYDIDILIGHDNLNKLADFKELNDSCMYHFNRESIKKVTIVDSTVTIFIDTVSQDSHLLQGDIMSSTYTRTNDYLYFYFFLDKHCIYKGILWCKGSSAVPIYTFDPSIIMATYINRISDFSYFLLKVNDQLKKLETSK
jgi:hypothetical protein